jgi:PD-(D/E)XK nuclease superfamily
MTENELGKQILDFAFEIHTELRLTNLRLGYLINFGEERLKDGIKRLANRLVDSD